MNASELRTFIRDHLTRDAFRLEVHQRYEVASDGNDFGRYLAGAAAPTAERKQPWLDRPRSEHERGLRRRRVRVVTRPVSEYTRYECEWSYAPNGTAGEDIRVLDLGERALPDVGRWIQSDWWLLDDQHLVHMDCGLDGEFLGASVIADAAEAGSARDRLWDAAEPFPMWWERHRELHRDHGSALRSV